MVQRTYAVMGASGNIGHTLTESLLKKGHKVKALGRDPSKLAKLKSQGAEIVTVKDFDHAESLIKAFNGADAIFSFIPPGYGVDDFGHYQDRVGEAILTALQKTKIPYVLNLSSVGAELADKTGPIKGLHRQEQRLNALRETQILHLRPNFFMENLFHLIPVIKQAGVLGMALRPDLPVHMVATKDIGSVAAEFLDRLDFKGHSIFDFEGPRSLLLPEAASILGKAIGKPDLKYVQFPYELVENAIITSGMASKTAKLMIEMYHAFNDKLCKPTQKTTKEHQGPTTLEEFSTTFAKAFKE